MSTTLFPETDLPASPSTIVLLCDMAPGTEADFFALLAGKDVLATKDGKPYYRVTFRDAKREVSFPIWSDAPHAAACRDEWKVGGFYKLRAVYKETNFGPQLDIRKIREVVDGDGADGFDPAMCLPRSRRSGEEMFAELRAIAVEEIAERALSELVVSLLDDHRDVLVRLPAAAHNHHAYAGGFLEHVLSVAKTCVYLAGKYGEAYHELDPPLETDLIVAGGILHDIGKVRELALTATGAEYSASGALIGHILQGRDMVREAAGRHTIDSEKLLRLEHIIVAHQRLPEWGAPKPPMTPEALLVHFADDMDAKLQMVVEALQGDASEGSFTTTRNPLKQKLYRGGGAE